MENMIPWQQYDLFLDDIAFYPPENYLPLKNTVFPGREEETTTKEEEEEKGLI